MRSGCNTGRVRRRPQGVNARVATGLLRPPGTGRPVSHQAGLPVVFPVPALDHELQFPSYKIHSWFRTGGVGYSHKILLNQAGADAPRAQAPREKNVRQWHVVCHAPIAPGRTGTGSWPTAQQPLGFRGPRASGSAFPDRRSGLRQALPHRPFILFFCPARGCSHSRRPHRCNRSPRDSRQNAQTAAWLPCP